MSILTIKEVSNKLQVSQSVVYTLIHEGKLPVFQIGRKFIIDEEVLDNYIKENCKLIIPAHIL